MKTSYQSFREYLVEGYENITTNKLILPEGTIMPDGGLHYTDEEILSLLFYLIEATESNGENWRDIERSLGHLEFDLVFDGFEEIYDKEGDIDYWSTARRNQEITSDLVIPATTIQEYFSEWVDSIDISKAKAKNDFNNLLQVGDQFLTFNYTDTLQAVYDVDDRDVCHIHGRQMEEIFFGHGNDKDYSEIDMGSNIGSEDDLGRIRRQLRKRTDIALKKHEDFFNKLEKTSIDKIYSYGFSFSHVDTIYLEEICRVTDTTNVVWYFNDYNLDSNKKGKLILLLRKCGYKGEFDTFSCK